MAADAAAFETDPAAWDTGGWGDSGWGDAWWQDAWWQDAASGDGTGFLPDEAGAVDAVMSVDDGQFQGEPSWSFDGGTSSAGGTEASAETAAPDPAVDLAAMDDGSGVTSDDPVVEEPVAVEPVGIDDLPVVPMAPAAEDDDVAAGDVAVDQVVDVLQANPDGEEPMVIGDPMPSAPDPFSEPVIGDGTGPDAAGDQPIPLEVSDVPVPVVEEGSAGAQGETGGVDTSVQLGEPMPSAPEAVDETADETTGTPIRTGDVAVVPSIPGPAKAGGAPTAVAGRSSGMSFSPWLGGFMGGGGPSTADDGDSGSLADGSRSRRRRWWPGG